jgi:glutamate synthase domain-containing protein 3
VSLSVAEIRDYAQINAYLAQALDRGAKVVRLTGVDGQRLLGSRLRGPWNAAIEVEGRAGPELAAEMDAPGLSVVALQGAADGAGRGLMAGRIVVLGPASDGLGYAMLDGTILALSGAGARAGLRQKGGLIAISGPVGPLAAERQSGGTFWVLSGHVGGHPGRGRQGGRLIAPGFGEPDTADAHMLKDASTGLGPWLPDAFGQDGSPQGGS